MDKVNKQQDKKKKVKQPDAAKQTDASQMSLNVSSDDSFAKTHNNQDISILNENNEFEKICFASDEMLESIQVEDSTVEIVGFIDEIEGPKIVGKAQHYQLLKFMVNNNSQHRVQVVVWNAEIERVKCHVQPNRVNDNYPIFVPAYLKLIMTFNVRGHRIVVHLDISPRFIRRHKTYGVLGHAHILLAPTAFCNMTLRASDHKDDQLYENNNDLLTLSISGLYLSRKNSLNFSYVTYTNTVQVPQGNLN